MPRVDKPAALVFLAALLAPATVQLFSDRATISIAEKRTLEPAPAWPKDGSDWSALPGRLDRFLRDHFGLREPLATGWSLLRYVLRYTPRVAVGREGWLYYPQYWGPKYGARTCGPLSTSATALAERLDRLAAHAATGGVQVEFAVAPDKETLYPEFLPRVPGSGAHCDLLAELRTAVAGARHLRTVDLQAALEAGKAKEQVYFRTDSHWNDVGGWRVARALLEGSCASGSACAKLPEAFPSAKTYSGDLAGLIGLGSVLSERYVALDVSEEKHAGRTLYVVGDSFSQSLLRFLRADASVGAVSWWHYGTGRIDFRRLLASKPDAMLIVIVERSLYDRDLLRLLASDF